MPLPSNIYVLRSFQIPVQGNVVLRLYYRDDSRSVSVCHNAGAAGKCKDRKGRQGDGAGMRLRIYQLHYQRVSIEVALRLVQAPHILSHLTICLSLVKSPLVLHKEPSGKEPFRLLLVV
jgi:hypothetical protein